MDLDDAHTSLHAHNGGNLTSFLRVEVECFLRSVLYGAVGLSEEY